MSRHYDTDDAAYADQRATDLQFAVFDDALHPDRFRIFASETIQSERYDVDLWIVGSSHVCRFRAPEQALTETLICDAHFASDRAPIMRTEDFDGEVMAQRIGGLVYRVEMIAETHDAGAFARRLDEALESCSSAVQFAYPSAPRAKERPMTRLEAVRVDNALFELATFHSYPQESTLVTTRTVIRLDST